MFRMLSNIAVLKKGKNGDMIILAINYLCGSLLHSTASKLADMVRSCFMFQYTASHVGYFVPHPKRFHVSARPTYTCCIIHDTTSLFDFSPGCWSLCCGRLDAHPNCKKSNVFVWTVGEYCAHRSCFLFFACLPGRRTTAVVCKMRCRRRLAFTWPTFEGAGSDSRAPLRSTAAALHCWLRTVTLISIPRALLLCRPARPAQQTALLLYFTSAAWILISNSIHPSWRRPECCGELGWPQWHYYHHVVQQTDEIISNLHVVLILWWVTFYVYVLMWALNNMILWLIAHMNECIMSE